MKFGFWALVCAAAFVAGPAKGQQLSNTYVSGKGSDSGNCALATPCRSFQYALSQTLTSGQIMVLDTAGYGSILIERAVGITAPSGVVAEATDVFVGNAVAFSLEGLTLNGLIYVDSVPYGTSSGGTVTRCTVWGGIQFNNNGRIAITDSIVIGDVSMQVTRGITVGASILRSRISGKVTAGAPRDFVDFGTTDVTDSFIGSFIAYNDVNTSYTFRMVRSSAVSITLGERDVAYLTGSSIDSLSLQDQAVAHSSGNNDIISVTGNLQSLLLR